jgi:hypothetical protein
VGSLAVARAVADAVDLAGLAPSGSLAPTEWVRLPPGPLECIPVTARARITAPPRHAPAGHCGAPGWLRAPGSLRAPLAELLERDFVAGFREHGEHFFGVRRAARLEGQLDPGLAHVQRHGLANVVDVDEVRARLGDEV